MKYSIIRSKRKTIAIQIRMDGSILVRAPLYTPVREIESFVASKESWICRHSQSITPVERLTEKELAALVLQARTVFAERVPYYAKKLGVTYGKITIRHQKTCWGSCSASGNLSFNCLLTLAPPEVLDSVIVHELCHRLEMNHQKAFYAHIYRIYPEYDKWHGWLKENGRNLIAKLPEM